MSKKQKSWLARIIVGGCMLAVLMILEHTLMITVVDVNGYNLVALFLFIAPFLVVGLDVVIKAVRNISHGQVFDENFLMLIATVGAFVVGEYEEGVAVMLFYQVGEFFQNIAVEKSRKSIKDLMDIAPEFANVERDGEIVTIDPDEVEIGDIIVVKPGEKVPVDGIVILGESTLDTSSLTGESVPRTIRVDDDIISGCVNVSFVIKMKATKEYDDSTVAQILELVENAGAKKGKTEKFITKFARVYTPLVVLGAAALFLIPSLITGDWFEWLQRACTFLVVSCPCALVISVPLGFFAGIGNASKKGILVKGGVYLEQAAKINTVVFDKTGTLTRGVFEITSINPVEGVSKEELLRIAAHAEEMSTHPIAMSIKKAYEQDGKKVDLSIIEENENIAGHGISAKIDGKHVLAGNAKLMSEHGVEHDYVTSAGTVCYLAVDEKYIGNIIISDVVKPEAKEAIDSLRENGVSNIVMLTGDRKEAGEKVAAELGLDKAYTDLLPGDKVTKVEELLAHEHKNEKLAFVGDGINDTPVIARSDVGFAMGAIGSDAAIEAADIVIMDDDIRKISIIKRIAKFTLGVVTQNIVFALVIKVAILILSAIGFANMWIAVFADVGVAMICILNSFRALYKK